MVLFVRGLFLFLIVLASAAQAAEFYEPVQTVRQLGMGGAYVFDDNDGASYMQNPAFSCFTKGLNWALVNVNFAVGDLGNYDWVAEHIVQDRETPTLENLSEFMGRNVYLRLGGYSSLTLPCFGSALYYNGTGKFVVQNPAFPHIDTFYMTETTLSVGGGLPIGENIALGMAAKRIQRKGGPYTFGPDSLSTLTASDGFQTLLNSIDNSGLGYGLDAGVAVRVPMPFNPTASLAWKDIGSTAFVKTSGVDAPARQKDNMVMGFSMEQSLILGSIAGAVEYRHVTDTGEQIGKKLHMGAEVSLLNMDFRVGLYQGYPTYGAAIDLWLMRLEGAWYSVEQGAYPGQTPEQRGQIGLSIDLSFDPNFKLVDGSGKRRRLKQRR